MCQSLPRAPRSWSRPQSRRPRPAGVRVSTSSQPGAFTLVELLVVIGIIVVLVGILLPVIGRAREQARTVQCASNIGQIYKSLVMYANENRGVLPIATGQPESMLTPVGLAIAGVRIEEWGWLNYRDGTLWPYVGTGIDARQQLFLCPSDEEPRFARQYIMPIANPDWPRNFSYNFSAYMSGYLTSTGATGRLRLTQIRQPTRKILIMEQEMPRSPSGFPAAPYAPNPGEPPGPPIVSFLTHRHMGKANEGFADGHVELIDPWVFRGDVPDLGQVDAFQMYVNVFSSR